MTASGVGGVLRSRVGRGLREREGGGLKGLPLMQPGLPVLRNCFSILQNLGGGSEGGMRPWVLRV